MTLLMTLLYRSWRMGAGGWQATAIVKEGSLGDYDDVMKAAVIAQHEWKQV